MWVQGPIFMAIWASEPLHQARPGFAPSLHTKLCAKLSIDIRKQPWGPHRAPIPRDAGLSLRIGMMFHCDFNCSLQSWTVI